MERREASTHVCIASSICEENSRGAGTLAALKVGMFCLFPPLHTKILEYKHCNVSAPGFLLRLTW